MVVSGLSVASAIGAPGCGVAAGKPATTVARPRYCKLKPCPGRSHHACRNARHPAQMAAAGLRRRRASVIRLLDRRPPRMPGTWHSQSWPRTGRIATQRAFIRRVTLWRCQPRSKNDHGRHISRTTACCLTGKRPCVQRVADFAGAVGPSQAGPECGPNKLRARRLPLQQDRRPDGHHRQETAMTQLRMRLAIRATHWSRRKTAPSSWASCSKWSMTKCILADEELRA